MARGHAEALMPLIARVMDQARARIRRARPHRRHHRSRQLHRPAGRHRRRRAASRLRPASRRSGSPRSPALRRRYIAADDSDAGRGGDRCPARPCLSAGVRRRRPHAGGAAHRAAARSGARGACRRRRASSAPAAELLAAAWPQDASRRRRWSSSAARPTSTGSRGSAPPRPTATAPPKPLYLRAPDAQPQDAARCRADDRILRPTVRARRAGAVGSARRATPPRSRRCMPPRSSAAGARTRSSACCSTATCSRIAR